MYSMYYIYVLKSLSRNYVYVGITSCIEKRFTQHNLGKNKTTKPYRPFKIIFTEEFESRIKARKREKYLKSGCGKEYIKVQMAKLVDALP